MARQFFSGNSIEQAVMSAARHYQVDPERLAFKPREKKHGFLNQRRRVVIEVDPENLEKPDEPEVARSSTASAPEASVTVEVGESTDSNTDTQEPETAESDENHSSSEEEDSTLEAEDSEQESDGPSDDDDPADDDEAHESDSGSDRGGRSRRGGRGGRGRGGDRKRQRRRDVDLKEFQWNTDEDGWNLDEAEGGENQEMAAVELCVERILDIMDLEIEYTITEGEVMELEFSGEDAEFLTEDNGKVLKAIEHIVPRTVRGLIGRSVSVNADCEGFRADHEESLRSAAEEMATEVVRLGKPKTLSPMNPADRRIVHLALVENPDVDTISHGHGFMKRVKIIPASS